MAEDATSVDLTEQDVTVTNDLAEILEGLSRPQKALSPKFFYDEAGSQLFERITELPEYYPTETELAIMRAHVVEMAELIGPRASLIEFGSGSSLKTRLLLENMLEPAVYVPVDISRELLVLSADGTSPAQRKGVNVPVIYTAAYPSFGLACAIAPNVPNNAGSLAPYRITAPEGSILNATYPSAVNARHIVGQMLPDVVFGCLHQIIPERVPAEGASCLWNLTFRGRTDRAANEQRLFTITAVTNGGTGARPIKDGLSGTAYPSGVRGTPVEINETVAPLIFRRKQLRRDSGGAGQYRGGLGQEIEIESAIGADFELLAAFDRIEHPARGRRGGKAGEAGDAFLASGERLRGKGVQMIKAGERLVIHTPGGGGYGDPRERERDAVRRDLERGLISKQAAVRDYGFRAD